MLAYKRSEETREKMKAAHRARWALKREQYAEGMKRGSLKKVGMKYKQPRNCHIYDQWDNVYESVEQICQELGLTERLVRLVLEGKRKSTDGYEFRVVSTRHREYVNRKNAVPAAPRAPEPEPVIEQLFGGLAPAPETKTIAQRLAGCPVINESTGDSFPTITKAAESIGFTVPALIQAIDAGRKIGGFRFRRL